MTLDWAVFLLNPCALERLGGKEAAKTYIAAMVARCWEGEGPWVYEMDRQTRHLMAAQYDRRLAQDILWPVEEQAEREYIAAQVAYAVQWLNEGHPLWDEHLFAMYGVADVLPHTKQ